MGCEGSEGIEIKEKKNKWGRGVWRGVRGGLGEVNVVGGLRVEGGRKKRAKGRGKVGRGGGWGATGGVEAGGGGAREGRRMCRKGEWGMRGGRGR